MSKKQEKLINNVGEIKVRKITQEMEESYLSYAMSVIVTRALPDVRDGLKPVQRRILYSMWSLGLKNNAKFRKSAAVVGEVLGKYHPHGDSSVYEAMARMAQDFSLRYPLVHGQGNFGSMDGDKPAAMRYTEAKLSRISEEMLFDIDKDTVDWRDNYDGTRKEPAFVPAKLPQLLLNGSMGIAVGMATNIPPHNLSELTNGICHLIDTPDATVEDLTEFVKGPDFPTGGIIYNKKDVIEAYSSGRGGVVTRAKADIIEPSAGKFQIVITEMTYQTNKATLIQKIAELVKNGKLIGIKDLRDESDKDGVRVVVELKKDAFPKKVLNKLYKTTELQKNFNFNMLALVDGIDPKVLNLKSLLEHYIKHRNNIVTRRTQFELQKAKDRAHILEGLKKALDHIDEIIKIIKKSPTKEEAHVNLINKFKFSDKQSVAILEMKLQTLAGLERKKIEDELAEKLKIIKELEDILKSPKRILGIVKKELQDLNEKFGDERKTKVIKGKVDEFSQEDLVANEETLISITGDGYIKRISPDSFRSQKRGGKGVAGASIKEGDEVDKVLSAMTHDDIMFFTNTGKVFRIKAHELPVSSRTAKGNAIVNFLQIGQDEKITSMIAIPKETEAKYLVMQTTKGRIKKSSIEDFENVRRSGLIAIGLDKEDSLGWVELCDKRDNIMVVTSNGQSIRFPESNVRTMGRTAAGVRAIKLKNDDEVIGMNVASKNNKNLQLLIISEKGYGKKTALSKYKSQSRGGSGIKTSKITGRTGKLISSHIVETGEEERDLIVSSNKGQIIRTSVTAISVLGRATQGVRIMKLKADEKLAAAAVL
ncbi:MAG: DNA gyrase subunit A [Patescibacteria group bacterium]|jgi:DNA gyrase subunit A|nr:DNA gyrase subunit A [Patescibacteria group bacterium]